MTCFLKHKIGADFCPGTRVMPLIYEHISTGKNEPIDNQICA
jgi:hypothetical protein